MDSIFIRRYFTKEIRNGFPRLGNVIHTSGVSLSLSVEYRMCSATKISHAL